MFFNLSKDLAPVNPSKLNKTVMRVELSRVGRSIVVPLKAHTQFVIGITKN